MAGREVLLRELPGKKKLAARTLIIFNDSGRQNLQSHKIGGNKRESIGELRGLWSVLWPMAVSPEFDRMCGLAQPANDFLH